MLRAMQIGISIADMELLTVGMIIDMYTEAANDHIEDGEDDAAPREASEEMGDFDLF